MCCLETLDAEERLVSLSKVASIKLLLLSKICTLYSWCSWVVLDSFLKAGNEWLYIGIDMSLKISILVGLGIALPLARYESVAGATREKAITAGAVGFWRWGDG